MALSFEDELTFAQLVAAKAELDAQDLIGKLGDGRGVVRANALLGLAALGHEGNDVLLFLRDADKRVARAAAEALVQLGKAQKHRLVAIAAALDEARPEVVAGITHMFASLVGHADDELIAVMDTGSTAVGDAVIGACDETGLRGLHLLHRAARDGRARVRLHAVRGIARLGVIEQAPSFDVLFAVETTDDVSDVRAAARVAIAQLKVRVISATAAVAKATPVVPAVPELDQRAMTPAEIKAAATIAPLGDLLTALDGAAVHTRLNAVRLLGAKGVTGVEVVRTLAARLADVDASVRLEVAQLLGKVGPIAQAVAPALVAGLSDEDTNVAAACEAALSTVGDAAAPALLDGLDTPNEARGVRVASLIGRLPEGPRLLREALTFTGLDVRIHAALGIANLGRERAGNSLPALAAIATASNARLKAAVSKAIAVLDPRPDRTPTKIDIDGFDAKLLTEAEIDRSKAAVASAGLVSLVGHMNDARLAVRANVALGLGTLGGDAVAAGEALAVMLRDDAPEVRQAAARSIERLGDAAVTATADALVRALGDDWLAAQVAQTLRTRADGPTGAAVDAALARGLDTPSSAHGVNVCELLVARRPGLDILCAAFGRARSQTNAAHGLILLGAAKLGAGRAVLEGARSDPSAQTRMLAAATLRTIDGPPAAPQVPAVAGFETTPLDFPSFGGGLSAAQLLPFLQDGRAVVRANAALGLGSLAAAGAPHATSLAALLKDDAPAVRIAAARALDKLGDDAVIATAPALVDALRGDPSVHAVVKQILAARGAKVEAALVGGLETGDETHGMRVAELIVALPNAPQLLFTAFDGPAQNVTINAALGIGLLGGKRAGAAGRIRLVNNLAGPVTHRRHMMVKALALLGPE